MPSDKHLLIISGEREILPAVRASVRWTVVTFPLPSLRSIGRTWDLSIRPSTTKYQATSREKVVTRLKCVFSRCFSSWVVFFQSCIGLCHIIEVIQEHLQVYNLTTDLYNIPKIHWRKSEDFVFGPSLRLFFPAVRNQISNQTTSPRLLLLLLLLLLFLPTSRPRAFFRTSSPM